MRCAIGSLERRIGAPVATQVMPYKAHKLESPPGSQVETTLSELAGYYELMYRMRRMEIAADMMYKAKLIRGFCHL